MLISVISVRQGDAPLSWLITTKKTQMEETEEAELGPTTAVRWKWSGFSEMTKN